MSKGLLPSLKDGQSDALKRFEETLGRGTVSFASRIARIQPGQFGDLALGYALYSRYCTQCHGVNGDGEGPVAQYLDPKPRNYQYGIFKFTSTPYGRKPRRADLIQTVQRGVTGTSMPSLSTLADTRARRRPAR